ncbi:HAD-IIB family hydrolase [Sulfitobacter sediminilitoris]|uniref:HAD-IIB family hydrolase n=1 Tax=Sulfitobacter sediminilitoris TaxID=2698830 RepID=UPI002E2D55CA|nr:HAD-IIB family hydrolase [Sulfitobacter sediminilitoris]
MITKLPLLVFTDLDGTLISHADYRWDAAKPALDTLRAIGAGIVMASSKTAPEIIALRQQLDLEDWPAIVENGAGVLAPNSHASPPTDEYLAVRSTLNQIPANLRRQYRGFGDMDVAEIAGITGLTAEAAALAAQRAFSEPGVWSGTPEERKDFLAALAQHGVMAREGGRFLTLSFGQTKADKMAEFIATYSPRHTVALGDAPNDVEMLEAAEFGIIVANPHRKPLPLLDGERHGRVVRTTLEGPEGWNKAVLELISILEVT